MTKLTREDKKEILYRTAQDLITKSIWNDSHSIESSVKFILDEAYKGGIKYAVERLDKLQNECLLEMTTHGNAILKDPLLKREKEMQDLYTTDTEEQ